MTVPLVGLPLSRIISASINLATLPSQVPNFNTCLILGTSTVIDVVSRMRSYASPGAVAADFGTSAEEYLAAVLWFQQAPQPSNLLIGRWAKTASSGQLIGAPISAANQAAAVWQAITTGSFKIQVDGGSLTTITGVSFAAGAGANMNAVAATISAALTGASIGAVCTWNSVFQRLQITSNTTGATSTVSFLTAAGSGVDISVLSGMAAADSGSYLANGIAAESAITAVTLFDTLFSSQWYGLVVLDAVDADHLAIAPFIEGSANLHYYGVTTSESAILTSGDTTNIAYKLSQLNYNKSGGQYSSSQIFAVISLLGRILTTNWNNNNSAITLFGKSEPGITAETLNLTQIANLETYNCNVFVNYNNVSAIIEPGVSFSGQFIDTIIGLDFIKASIQNNISQLLIGNPTKIPQTDGGMHQITTQITAGLQAGVNSGLLAPGPWSGQGFGQLQPGGFLSKGYYVYAPPISIQTLAQRSARVSVPFQCALRMAGAVHSASVQLNIGF